MTARCAIALLLAVVQLADAQFNPGLLQNSSYWGYGKSEFDVYDAQFMRDGQRHACELLMIFTPEFVDAATLMTLSSSKQPGSLPVIRLNEIATVPRGIAMEQRSITAVWNAQTASIIQLWFNGTDSITKIFKMLSPESEKSEAGWNYSATSGGKIDVQKIALPNGGFAFYDELPLRIRLLDFSKTSGDVELQLAPTIATGVKDFGAFKPAKISWKSDDRETLIDVTHDGGKDQFVLDRNFPHLLREWQMADGSQMKMKNSLRIDYRNYMKNGDRERALKDPMLRHPD